MRILLNMSALKAAARRRMAGWSSYAGTCMLIRRIAMVGSQLGLPGNESENI